MNARNLLTNVPRTRIVAALVLAIAVLVLGFLARPSPPTLADTVSGDPALTARVRPLLNGTRDQVSVAQIDGGTVTYAHFGASEATEYEIGSITKTFTAHLLAEAIARGEVQAETKVGTLLPLGDAPVADVTLAELVSHRSGLPRVASRPQDIVVAVTRSFIGHDPYSADAAGVIEQARAATLNRRGEVAYSNLGVALLGQALATASGRDYATLVEERLFTPLGMASSNLPVTAARLPTNAPTGWTAGGRRAAAWTMAGSAPAGGIRSTPADMVRYTQALLAGTAPGSEALTPRWPDGKRQIGYAWITQEIDGRTVTWHNGGTGGFASILMLDREHGRAIIVLSNTAASVDTIGAALLTGGN
jgi:CubicO group peptidase (beta-lactamase class C family)